MDPYYSHVTTEYGSNHGKYEIRGTSRVLKWYSCSKTDQMHQCLKFILLEWHTTCFRRSFRPSSGVQDCTDCCQTDTAVCLLASRQQYLFDKCLLLYVQSLTPDDGRKDCLKHVECHSKIKINLIRWCMWLVLLYEYITMHGPVNIKY